RLALPLAPRGGQPILCATAHLQARTGWGRPTCLLDARKPGSYCPRDMRRPMQHTALALWPLFLLVLAQVLGAACTKVVKDPADPTKPQPPTSVLVVVQSGLNCNQCGASRSSLNFKIIQMKSAEVPPG